MRIFLAVDLDQSLRSKIGAVQRALGREGISGIRWTDPGGIHLTLRFCGEMSRETADRLGQSIAPGAPHSPFSIRIGGLGTFPPRGSPRVLFLSVREAGPLVPLAKWVEERVVAAGLPRETRPFHPHLTLGRFRPGAPVLSRGIPGASADEDLGTLSVDRIIMFESHLGAGKPRYEALKILPLLGATER
jgi:2'-5' RNA ligase